MLARKTLPLKTENVSIHYIYQILDLVVEKMLRYINKARCGSSPTIQESTYDLCTKSMLCPEGGGVQFSRVNCQISPNAPTLGRYSLFTIVDAGLFPIIRAKSSCIMHVHDYARRQELAHFSWSLLVKIDQSIIIKHIKYLFLRIYGPDHDLLSLVLLSILC